MNRFNIMLFYIQSKMQVISWGGLKLNACTVIKQFMNPQRQHAHLYTNAEINCLLKHTCSLTPSLFHSLHLLWKKKLAQFMNGERL